MFKTHQHIFLCLFLCLHSDQSLGVWVSLQMTQRRTEMLESVGSEIKTNITLPVFHLVPDRN